MAIYSFTYFLNALGFFTAGKQRRTINFMVIALLIFLSGTRYYMAGSDVYVYEGIYLNVPDVPTVLTYIFTGVNNGVNTNYEVGFLLACSIIKSFGFSYYGFILVWALLFYFLITKGLKDFIPNMSVFWAVFMYKIMFYNTFISIRQGLTMAMFCYMLRFIRDRKWLPYFIWCTIAYFEHKAALVLFPLYFIPYMPTSKNFIGCVAFLFLPTWFLRSRIDMSWVFNLITLIDSDSKSLTHWATSTEQISLIHTLECYLVVVLVLIFYDKIVGNKRNREARLALQLFMIAIPIFTIFSDWIFLTRIKDYFVMMYGIIFSFVLDDEIPLQPTLQTVHFTSHDWRFHRFLSLAIILLCYVGMARYVIVFDGGVLNDFSSFLFERSAWIF